MVDGHGGSWISLAMDHLCLLNLEVLIRITGFAEGKFADDTKGNSNRYFLHQRIEAVSIDEY